MKRRPKRAREMSKRKLYLACPRGFCAGVKRALTIVDKALEAYGTPLYVFHEIVHNDYIVKNLRDKGVIFVDDVNEVPVNSNLIYSAHGVSRVVESDSGQRNLHTVDASCPLVKKVHTKANRLSEEGYSVLLIGHRSHPEVAGTIGQVDAPVQIIETIDCVANVVAPEGTKLAYLTQTTLSADDTKDIVDALYKRFPDINGANDICYATQNRQNAVKVLAKKCDTIFVIGSVKSSNSNRLREVARKLGCAGFLIDSVDDLKPEMYENAKNIGISAGASAPECLVDGLVEFFEAEGWAEPILVETVKENVKFSLPKI